MIQLETSALIDPLRLVWPGAWVGHIPFASWLIEKLKPRILVELGTHTGNSYSAFCQAISSSGLSTRAYAVDTWLGDEHAGTYGDAVYVDFKNYHDPLYSNFSQLLRMTFDDALSYFEDGSVDLLHIDGLHTYEAVKHDFETWLPKMSHRGIVLFHDTQVFDRNFGVHKLWNELRQAYPGFNFDHSNGLGVLLVGGDRLPELVDLAEGVAPNNKWSEMKQVFSSLGANIERRLSLIEQTAQMGNQQRQLEQFTQQITEQTSALHKLTNERDTALSKLNTVLNSNSWKMTMPLRVFARVIRGEGSSVKATLKK